MDWRVRKGLSENEDLAVIFRVRKSQEKYLPKVGNRKDKALRWRELDVQSKYGWSRGASDSD